jgi:hypothetical protein
LKAWAGFPNNRVITQSREVLRSIALWLGDASSEALKGCRTSILGKKSGFDFPEGAKTKPKNRRQQIASNYVFRR